MFKQTVPAVGLAIEQGTTRVPSDGAYHVLVGGRIVFSSKARKRALAEYQRLRGELLKDGVTSPSKVDVQEALRRERASMTVAGMLAASSKRKRDKATSRGGRGGRGGV